MQTRQPVVFAFVNVYIVVSRVFSSRVIVSLTGTATRVSLIVPERVSYRGQKNGGILCVHGKEK